MGKRSYDSSEHSKRGHEHAAAPRQAPCENAPFFGYRGGINWDLHKGDVAIPAKWHYVLEGALFNEKEDGSGEYEVFEAPWANYK